MPVREHRWKDLVPGVIALAVLVFGALFILTRVGVGNLPGRKVTLYALTEQARGILRGSDVWLGGTRVGMIASVAFLPPDPGSTDRILLRIDLLEKHMHLVRRDSYAQIRGGSRLIGNPVLHLSIGTARFAPVSIGDTLRSVEQYDAEEMMSRVSLAMRILPFIVSDVRSLSGDFTTAGNAFGRYFRNDSIVGPAASVGELFAQVQQLMQTFDRGTFGALSRDTALGVHLRSVQADLDSLKTLYRFDGSMPDRFMRDAALLATMESVVTQFREITTTLGSRMADYTTGQRAEQLRREVERVTANLRALQQDAKRHPLRYIVF